MVAVEATTFDALTDAVRRRYEPLSGSVELTYRCNERCAMCYLGPDWGKGRKGDELTTEEVFGLLDQIRDAGCFYLLLTGGEITLRKDLYEIIDYAGGNGLCITLKTNGTRITQEFIDAVRRNPVQSVDISLLGSSEATHDRLAVVPGSFSKTIEGMKALRAADIPVKVSFTAMTLNFQELHRARTLAHTLGCDFQWTSEVAPRDDRSVIPLTLRLHRDEQMQAQEVKVQERSEDNGGVYPASGYTDTGWFCGAGYAAFNVNPYGEVQPCMAMRMDCGNVRQQGFSDIWYNAAPFKRIRALQIADVFGCKDCPVRDYCEACPGLFYTEMGDITVPSPHTCEMAEMRHQAATGEYKAAGSRDENGNLPRPVNVIVGTIAEPLVLRARLSDA